MQRLFDGWWNNLDRLAISKSRKIMQLELHKRIHLRRGLTGLLMHTEDKRHQKHIIKVYQTKMQMVSKARVFSAMVKHCYDFKLVAKGFANMIRPMGARIMGDAFDTWK